MAFGYGTFAVFLINLNAPLGLVLIGYVLPAGVALGGGIATARGEFWGPLLIAPLAVALAIFVSPLAPLFTAALVAVAALALLETALLWMRRPHRATGPTTDQGTSPEFVRPA